MLVTGRRLDDLLEVFPDAGVFDRIVAENGALLHDPSTSTSRLLAAPPPPHFLRALDERRVPVAVGRSIVATSVPHDVALLSAIRELGIDWHVIFNKGSAMALPSGVTKATGLVAALAELQVPPERTVGVGDAENDRAFMQMCGLRVAVSNALPAVKADAHVVTAGACGDGVRELMIRILSEATADSM